MLPNLNPVFIGLCFMSAAWANADKAEGPGGKFVYPDAEKTGLFGGRIINLGMNTKDGFDKVIAFYEKATGEKLQVKTAGASSLRGEDRVLIDASRHRTMQVRVFVHTAEKYFLTVVISRAKGEDFTHITLVFCERDAK